jgi:hypothetical protein
MPLLLLLLLLCNRGAFKFRGAFNSVQQLTEQQAAKGVVTHRQVPVSIAQHAAMAPPRQQTASPH